MKMPPLARLVITSDAAQLRRTLGPTAWGVLEELALTGEPDAAARQLVAVTSARRLAAWLGLSKDTVAAALRRLSIERLVTRCDHRDDMTGTFARSTYEVTLPPGLERQELVPSTVATTAMAPGCGGRSERARVLQPNLFDPPNDPNPITSELT